MIKNGLINSTNEFKVSTFSYKFPYLFMRKIDMQNYFG